MHFFYIALLRSLGAKASKFSVPWRFTAPNLCSSSSFSSVPTFSLGEACYYDRPRVWPNIFVAKKCGRPKLFAKGPFACGSCGELRGVSGREFSGIAATLIAPLRGSDSTKLNRDGTKGTKKTGGQPGKVGPR